MPEVRYVGGNIWQVEVDWHFVAKEQGRAAGNVRVTGEVKEDLEGIGVSDKPQVNRTKICWMRKTCFYS